MVRDWNDEDDYPFGWEGGEKYLKETTEPGEDQAEEHRMRRKYFQHAFGEIPCLLLPHPGRAIKSSDPCKFGGEKYCPFTVFTYVLQADLISLCSKYSSNGNIAFLCVYFSNPVRGSDAFCLLMSHPKQVLNYERTSQTKSLYACDIFGDI